MIKCRFVARTAPLAICCAGALIFMVLTACHRPAEQSDEALQARLNIAIALEIYLENYGRYPTTEEGFWAARGLRSELERVVEIPPDLLYDVKDDWGTTYTYSGPTFPSESYKLISAGPDKQMATADDIVYTVNTLLAKDACFPRE